MKIFDDKTLEFRDITKSLTLLVVIGLISVITFTSLIVIHMVQKNIIITEETRTIILNEHNQFSRDKLKEYVLELNIKFPYIVLAQAELETGGFKSRVFKENNNLFGMREAKQRPTTNKGTENNHAYYDSWRESVVDYALFSAQFLSDIKTENQYFQYLKENYAEDSTYVSKLKQIISKKALKDLVN